MKPEGFYLTPWKGKNPATAPTQTSPALPGAGQLAVNAAGALARNVLQAARGGPVLATREIAESRHEICRTCEHYHPGQDRCAHRDCGCFLKAKAWLHAERCPAGKW